MGWFSKNTKPDPMIERKLWIGKMMVASITIGTKWGSMSGYPHLFITESETVSGKVLEVGMNTVCLQVDGRDKWYETNGSQIGGIRIIEVIIST